MKKECLFKLFAAIKPICKNNINVTVISGSKVYELINMLKDKQVLGVQVTIVTWAPDSYGFGDAAYWIEEKHNRGRNNCEPMDRCYEYFFRIPKKL